MRPAPAAASRSVSAKAPSDASRSKSLVTLVSWTTGEPVSATTRRVGGTRSARRGLPTANRLPAAALLSVLVKCMGFLQLVAPAGASTNRFPLRLVFQSCCRATAVWFQLFQEAG